MSRNIITVWRKQVWWMDVELLIIAGLDSLLVLSFVFLIQHFLSVCAINASHKRVPQSWTTELTLKHVNNWGKISLQPIFQIHNNEEPLAPHYVGSAEFSDCNRNQLSICNRLFFLIYFVYPQEHHMKSRCFRRTETCLSRFLPTSWFCSTDCGQKTVPTVPFQGACEIPLQVLSGEKNVKKLSPGQRLLYKHQ